jgi:microcystin-dependent protein
MATSLLDSGVEFPDNSTQTKALPQKGIIMWYGDISNIPQGWALCDGLQDTPDLRDKFVVGAGDEYIENSTGGAETVMLASPNIPKHSHSSSSSGETGEGGKHSHSSSVSTVPAHSHPYSPVALAVPPPFNYAGRLPGPDSLNTGSINPADSHGHSVGNISNEGAHTHTGSITLGEIGNSDDHNNLPPFFCLMFLMRL